MKNTDEHLMGFVTDEADLYRVGLDYDLVIFESIDGFPLLNYSYMIDHNVIAICHDGWAHGQYNMQEVTFQKGDMMVLLSDSMMMFDEFSPDYRATTIILSRPFATALSQSKSMKLQVQFVERPVMPLTEQERQVAESFFTQLQYVVGQPMEGRSELVTQIFSVMFRTFMQFEVVRSQPTETGKSRREQVIENFMTLAIRHHREAREVIWYADKLCMTPKYLASIIKTTGKSANDWINQYAILDAKQLLRTEKEMTILEVSERLGFTDQAVFSKYFKKHVGMTPSAYRES